MLKPSAQPIPRHAADFLDWLDVERGLSSKSQENYSRFLNKFLEWLKLKNLEHLKPHELSPDHIWNYRVFLARQYLPRTKQPLKKSTQNYYLIALRSLLNYFSHRDILSLPAEKVTLARDKAERQVRFLLLDQLEKLFAAPDIHTPQGVRDRAMLETLFSTGMRVAELVSLNRNQLRLRAGTRDFELGIIGKGQRVRTVYFSERALEWLRRYLAARTDQEKALFINFRGPRHAPRRLTVRSVEKMIKRYAILAGLPPNTTPHVMRHSFATDLLNQGVDLRTIQEFLGHKSIAATQIYAHVTSKKLREIHKKFHGKNA
ncbi:MAG: tyrosine-type recombinase/integrase [Candidatus Sungbacteria bacterium]|uniref:Tyrosine-type recombinase/integrase n=1 Tax=Candidatus Sungiibacteriota bacterium TaxID=2750080 RepID=A0A932YVN4_9BACT|nr:tyrosine-type recombinase/integrase [Candidatus Sungbacteria bacterium]